MPGNRGVDFPEGTGLKVPVGSKIYLQVHYNTANGERGPDLSRDRNWGARTQDEMCVAGIYVTQ